MLSCEHLHNYCVQHVENSEHGSAADILQAEVHKGGSSSLRSWDLRYLNFYDTWGDFLKGHFVTQQSSKLSIPNAGI